MIGRLARGLQRLCSHPRIKELESELSTERMERWSIRGQFYSVSRAREEWKEKAERLERELDTERDLRHKAELRADEAELRLWSCGRPDS